MQLVVIRPRNGISMFVLLSPQDVLATLLNNLKVQERQNRVCTTVAIAIVAETCSPFTVLPALMNEYRVPELNVQNGVLKSLSFLFEYIGEMGKDYIYAVTPLLEDALMDRYEFCNRVSDRWDPLRYLLQRDWCYKWVKTEVYNPVKDSIYTVTPLVEGVPMDRLIRVVVSRTRFIRDWWKYRKECDGLRIS